MKVFVGRRDAESGRAEVLIDEEGHRSAPPNDPLATTAGYEFGYEGSGPLTTAVMILRETTGSRSVADRLAPAFEAQVVSRLPRDGFGLSEDEVRQWIRQRAELGEEAGAPPM